MRSRINNIFVLIAAILGGVLIFSPPLNAADPAPIACPNGQTIFLEGETTPNEALLIYMRGRAVGGGVSGVDGRFKLPLRPQERPGIYVVEVRLRSSRATLTSFTCYVDIALENASPSAEAPTPGNTPSQTPRILTPVPATVARPTAGATISPTAAATTSTTMTTSTVRSTAATTTTTVTTTVTTTATVTTTGTTTATGTPVLSGTLEINDIVLRDPAFPEVSEEYVQIRNLSDSPVSLAGVRLVNVSRPEVPSFVFPAYNLGSDDTISVFSTIGDDDLDQGDFFWDQVSDIWRIGDRAELRDAQGRVISLLFVPDQQS